MQFNMYPVHDNTLVLNGFDNKLFILQCRDFVDSGFQT